MVLKLDQVSKYFTSERPVLESVSFQLEDSQIVALLGKSGSGKSTLLRLSNGLEIANQGKVLCLGQDPKKLRAAKLRGLRKRVGFVFQDLGLIDRLSAIENVLVGSLASLRVPRLGVFTYPKSLYLAACENLDRVGLLGLSLQRADSLSGGERQRLAVARCLMQVPEIIIADEPVSSLDPETAAQVLSLIVDVAKERRIPVLMSLHQPELAVRFADRIIGIRAGKLLIDVPASKFDKGHADQLYG